MSDEIRIEMSRLRKTDGTLARRPTRKTPFVLYPMRDGTMEIVNAYDYFLQAFCEVRPYARTEISRLRDACKDFFEKHGCDKFSKHTLAQACRRNGIKFANSWGAGRSANAIVSLFGELSPMEKAINFIHSRDGDVWFDEILPSPGKSTSAPWQTRVMWNVNRVRRLILRETVPPPIVPDGPR